MKYPKLWNGTSAIGEGLVRALQRVRSPFLSAKAGDVRAVKTGTLSAVYQGFELELFAAGTVLKEKEGVRYVRYRGRGLRPFDTVSFVARVMYGWHVGRNRFFTLGTAILRRTTKPGLQVIDMAAVLALRSSQDRRTYDKFETLGVVVIPQDWVGEFQGFTADFFGFDKQGHRRGGIAFTWPHPTLLDPLGNPVVRPAFLSVNFKTGMVESEAYLPRPPLTSQSQFLPPLITSVTPLRKAALVASYAFSRTEPNVTIDAQVYMYVSDDGGAGWLLRDVLPLIAHRLADNATAQPGSDRKYREGINKALQGLSDVEWLVFTPLKFVALVVMYSGNSGKGPKEWLHAALGTANAGESWEAREMPDIPGFPDAPAVIQHAVVLGERHAIIKRRPYTAGRLTFDAQRGKMVPVAQDAEGEVPDSSFARTTDSGVTWEIFTPTGLPSLKVYDLGHVKVVRPYVDQDDQGEILITAWDDARKAYTIYRSADTGNTWTFKAVLAKSLRREGRLNAVLAADDTESLPASFTGVQWVGPTRKPRPASEVTPWRYDAAYFHDQDDPPPRDT